MSKEYELTQEDIDTIFTGKRPEGMDYNIYKVARSQLNRATKQYLKGRMFHKSVWYEEVPKIKEPSLEVPDNLQPFVDKVLDNLKPKESPEFIRKTSTYVKPVKE